MPIEAHEPKVFRLQEQDKYDDIRSTTPAERLEMMWQLTLDAWAFKGERIVGGEFRKDVVSVIRLIEK